MRVKYFSLALFALISLNDAQANIRSRLKQTFNALNFNSNISGASAFEDQSGGFYTGGSVYARTPSRNINLANIQLPDFNGSCNGINAFLGALSYIKGAEILTNLRTAIPGAAGYSFSIAMQTALPMVYNALTEMQDWIQKINSMNMNSCHLSALMASGIFPQSEASSSTLCNALALGTKIPGVDDYASAKHKCSIDKERRSINQNKSGAFEDILGEEFNLVWKAIRKSDFLTNDQETSEYFMSIAGTLIKHAEDRYATHKPSLAFDQDLIEMLIFGSGGNHKSKGAATIHRCDEPTKCLNLKKEKYILDKKGSIAYQVEEVLNGLLEKIKTRQPATNKERGLVDSTPIPIMEMLIVQTAHRQGKPPIQILNYKNEIAYDILLNELQAILDIVYLSLEHLEQAQIDGETINRFKQDLKDVRSRLVEQRNSIYKHIERSIYAIERTEQLKQQLYYRFVQYTNLKKM